MLASRGLSCRHDVGVGAEYRHAQRVDAGAVGADAAHDLEAHVDERLDADTCVPTRADHQDSTPIDRP
jgi:hypothetical protein